MTVLDVVPLRGRGSVSGMAPSIDPSAFRKAKGRVERGLAFAEQRFLILFEDGV